MSVKSFPQITKGRFDKFDEYFRQEVMSGDKFICASQGQCKRANRAGIAFYEGQCTSPSASITTSRLTESR